MVKGRKRIAWAVVFAAAAAFLDQARAADGPPPGVAESRGKGGEVTGWVWDAQELLRVSDGVRRFKAAEKVARWVIPNDQWAGQYIYITRSMAGFIAHEAGEWIAGGASGDVIKTYIYFDKTGRATANWFLRDGNVVQQFTEFSADESGWGGVHGKDCGGDGNVDWGVLVSARNVNSLSATTAPTKEKQYFDCYRQNFLIVQKYGVFGKGAPDGMEKVTTFTRRYVLLKDWKLREDEVGNPLTHSRSSSEYVRLKGSVKEEFVKDVAAAIIDVVRRGINLARYVDTALDLGLFDDGPCPAVPEMDMKDWFSSQTVSKSR